MAAPTGPLTALRTALGPPLLIATLLAGAVLAPAVPAAAQPRTLLAAAAGDVALPNGCVLVANPTPTTHTTCPGADFTGLESSLTDQDLSYAELAGATFGGTTSLANINFTNADLTDAQFTIGSSNLLNLTGATLNGALLPAANGDMTLPDFNFAVLDPANFAAGQERNFYYGTFDNLAISDMTINGKILFIDSSVKGLDLSGSTFNGPFSVLYDSVADNADVSGVTFNDDAAFTQSSILDSDFSGTSYLGDVTSFGGSIADRSDFSNTTFRSAEVGMGGFFGSHTTFTGSIFDTGTSTQNQFDWDGSFLDHTDFSNTTFQGVSGVAMNGNGMDDTTFEGATIAIPMSFDGVTALRGNFQNIAFTAPLTARGMYLTSSDWRGTTFVMSDSDLESIDFTGSVFAFANLAGTTFELQGGGYYLSDANLAGATLNLDDWSGGHVLHRINGKGATFNAGYSGGNQFQDADLTDATFNFTDMSGSSFVDSNLTRAVFNVDRLGGLIIARSNLTDAALPAAHNSTSDPLKWLYGLFWIDNELTGSTLAPVDVSTVSTDGTAASVPFQAGPAWDNTDGQDPFQADGSYWWGSGLTCDHANNSAFPVGRTTVSCTAGFKHSGVNLGAWDAAPFSWTKPGAGGRSSLSVTALGAAPVKTWAADQVLGKGNTPGSVSSGYLYGNLSQPNWYDADQIQLNSLPMTFNVDVQQAPNTTATDYSGLVDDPITLDASSLGYPAPNVTVTGLPDGVSYATAVTPATEAGALTTSVTLAGTPTTAGSYTVTVTGTNAAGTDTDTLTVTLFDPAAQAVPSKIEAGAYTVVTGYGFRANTRATLHTEAGDALDVDPVTTSSFGVATFNDVMLEDEGTYRFLIKGADGLEALTNEVVVGTAAPVEPPPAAGGPVTPLAPTVVSSQACEVEDTVAFPATPGVLYTSVRNGRTVTVTVTAADGVVLADGSVTQWALSIGDGATCAPAAAAAADPEPAAQPLAPGDSALPVTGSEGVFATVTIALGLLIVGSALVLVVRRRQPRRATGEARHLI